MAVHKPPTVPDCSNHSHPRGTGGAFGRQLGLLHFPHVLVTNAQTSVSRDQPFRHQGTNIQRIEKNTRLFIYEKPMYSMYIYIEFTRLFNSKPLKERGCLCVHILYFVILVDYMIYGYLHAYCLDGIVLCIRDVMLPRDAPDSPKRFLASCGCLVSDLSWHPEKKMRKIATCVHVPMIQWVLFRQNHGCHTITLCIVFVKHWSHSHWIHSVRSAFQGPIWTVRTFHKIRRRSTASICKRPGNSSSRTLLGSFCLLLSRHWCNTGFKFIIDFVNEAHPVIPWNTGRGRATFMEWDIAVLWLRVSEHGRNTPNIHGE